MRQRPLVLVSSMCLLTTVACSSFSDDANGSPETVEKLTEDELIGSALLHCGFEERNPETNQVLSSTIRRPVNSCTQRSSFPRLLWIRWPPRSPFTTSSPRAGNSSPTSKRDPTPSTSPNSPIPRAPRTPRVRGAKGPKSSPTSRSSRSHRHRGRCSSSQEGNLALDDDFHPDDWTLAPDESLHIRNSVPTEQGTSDDGSLVVRSTDDTVVNATLNTNVEQWQNFNKTIVWRGQGSTVPGGQREGPARWCPPGRPQRQTRHLYGRLALGGALDSRTSSCRGPTLGRADSRQPLHVTVHLQGGKTFVDRRAEAWLWSLCAGVQRFPISRNQLRTDTQPLTQQGDEEDGRKRQARP